MAPIGHHTKTAVVLFFVLACCLSSITCDSSANGPGNENTTTCKGLKQQQPHLKSGLYNITVVGGETVEMYCDMETDGGGWLMIGRATVKTEDERWEVDYEKIQSNDITQLSKVTTGRFLLSMERLNKLSQVYPAQQLRLDCWKPYHGRRLHMKTSTNEAGTWVVKWLVGKRSDRPPSCGSYQRLEEDDSFIAQNCERWDGGKWDNNNIYNYPMVAYDGNLRYWISLWNGLTLCDDNYNHPHFSSIGTWNYYIR